MDRCTPAAHDTAHLLGAQLPVLNVCNRCSPGRAPNRPVREPKRPWGDYRNWGQWCFVNTVDDWALQEAAVRSQMGMLFVFFFFLNRWGCCSSGSRCRRLTVDKWLDVWSYHAWGSGLEGHSDSVCDGGSWESRRWTASNSEERHALLWSAPRWTDTTSERRFIPALSLPGREYSRRYRAGLRAGARAVGYRSAAIVDTSVLKG
ncbi:hypothetical protein EDB86DRAFT_1018342 [Lactarius hatsudake]|nr:hypothetical protein EDB86DRAFT_1018342 [Lactarius hatsudake]